MVLLIKKIITVIFHFKVAKQKAFICTKQFKWGPGVNHFTWYLQLQRF